MDKFILTPFDGSYLQHAAFRVALYFRPVQTSKKAKPAALLT